MKAFMDKDFLLDTQTAATLYHSYAEACPIIDYHCHISPREIWEDMRYDNITQVWLGGDHYKWRLMRCAGVSEQYITGSASDHDKFIKWAGVLGRAIGNPLYHWSHLELRRFFGYEGVLNESTAEEVWELCNSKLKSEGYSVRGLIARSNVETICTTDDPTDTLEWHEKLAADESFKTAVLPAWRPDKAMNLEKPDYLDYLKKLEKASGIKINSVDTLKAALSKRMEYFHKHNCRLSDHGIDHVYYITDDPENVEAIFQSRLDCDTVDELEDFDEIEAEVFKTDIMLFLARKYKELGWTMQLHFSCKRNNNTRMFEKLGPDTGYDCIMDSPMALETADFLNELDMTGKLPKTILYSLNPNDNQAIDTICGCFQSDEAVSKVQHGSAWWFNDHLSGMTDQLTSLANLGYLAGFVGMLTDSRSFLSYPRHEYFRRILCRLLGRWVEDELYPADMETLSEIVRGVSYENAKRYFGFAQK